MKMIMFKFLFRCAYRFYYSILSFLFTFRYCFPAYIRNIINYKYYYQLSFAELNEKKISDTVFIFGSGSSINDIRKDEWNQINRFNTISYRLFSYQNFIRADFHVTGEVDEIEEYSRLLRENPFYKNSYFIVQKGWNAYNGNNLIGLKKMNKGSKVFRYKRINRGKLVLPSESIENGLVHGFNSVTGVINFAYLMGWKKIVLAGVDMNNHDYFYMPEGETRSYEKPGVTRNSPYTNSNSTLKMIDLWNNYFKKKNVQLFVLNPKSLLAEVLPVYTIKETGTEKL